MMSSSASRWLILVLILAPLVAENHQASILHQSVVWFGGEPPLQTTRADRDSKMLTHTKFIILTTGDQIKLYPLVTHHEEAQNLVPTYQHYLITTSKLKAKDDRELTMKPGNNSFSRLLLSQNTDKRKPTDYKQLPNGRVTLTNRNEENFYYDGSDHRDSLALKEPWIVDVDYFFDPEFCHPFISSSDSQAEIKLNDCLVIVWLDKNNKLVHYGSLNLATNPIKTLAGSSSSTSRATKELLLRRFAPISVGGAISEMNQHESQVFAMVVDKRRAKLHVVFSDGSKPYANRILSGKLTSSPDGPFSMSKLQDVTIFEFNHGCLTKPSSLLVNTSYENLSIDEENGDWLFYFDRYQGGKIFALNVNPKFSTNSLIKVEENGDANKTSAPIALQALVRDIPVGEWQEEARLVEGVKNATGMAMDPASRRLFWLNEAREIHSCDYAGYDAKLVDRLSPKPVIRSPHSMQVFQDTLYISDPTQKTLIAYRLAEHVSISSSDRPAKVNEINYHESRPLDISRTTHQVLLVEMPTIYGFRVVDIERFDGEENRLESDELDISLKRLENKYDEHLASYHQAKLDLMLLGGWQTHLGGKDFELNLAGTKSKYIHLLLDRIYNNSRCAYDQSDLDSRHLHGMSRGLLFFFIVYSGVLMLALLALWFMLLPRLRKMVVKVREDRLTTGSISKCPV